MNDTGKVNIHGKEYTTVAARVQRFREEHGDKYGIVTEVIDRTDNDVLVKASIIFTSTVVHEDLVPGRAVSYDRVIATGYAEERRDSSQINRTSALENAETSAIGQRSSQLRDSWH